MKKLIIGLSLLSAAACSEVDQFSPRSALRNQRLATFEAQLRYQTADGTTELLDGATLPAGTSYRIFTDREALRWEGEPPFKCLFWLDSTYHNRENVTPYDFNHVAGAKTGAGQNEELSAGEHRIKVRGYYGTPENITHQQEDVVTFAVSEAAPGEEETIVFFEDFEDATLDPKNFSARFWWSERGFAGFNQDVQWFRPENVEVRDGKAHLLADNVLFTADGRTFRYTGGVISTHYDDGQNGLELPDRDGFEFRYGTIEVNLRLPQRDAPGKNIDGMWPAVWLITSDDRWPPEIDILEVLGERPNTAEFHVHYGQEPNHRQQGDNTDAVRISEGYHTYKLVWTPDKLEWYIDDEAEPRYQVTETDEDIIPDVALHLIINNAVSSGLVWGQAPTGATSFPNAVSVDWVRITQPKP